MAALPVGDEWKEGDEDDITVIKNCLCPNCNCGTAETTMLPTKVPLFREIIVMNLSCDECGFRSAEVNFGGQIQEKGERIKLTATSPDDLNRQLVKSDSARFLVPRLEFEIPASTQRGNITTLEGMLLTAAENLEALQPERLRLGDVDNFHRCHKVIAELKRFAGSEEGSEEDEEKSPVFPFDVILDDPAGNSFIENPNAPAADPHLSSEKYFRTPTQDLSLGLQPSQQSVQDGYIDDTNPAHKNVANAPKGKHTIERDDDINKNNKPVGSDEALKFPTTCAHCYKPTETDMCITDIPHFKEVIIMSMVCEHCGYKSNEVKGGGAIPRFGTKITLTVTDSDDLAREVLKSDTAGIAIPELGLELEEGGLDGVYTTIEGLIEKMHDRLKQANPFGSGDAARKQHATNDGGDFSGLSLNHVRYSAFLQKLQDMADGKVLPFTLIISDPLSNSFVGPIPKDAIALSLQAEKEGSSKCYDNYVDKGMELEEYERTHGQNEMLGLNDMRTENYQADGEKKSYGTDNMQELPDRIQRLDVRGPDHPLNVGKAPVDGRYNCHGLWKLKLCRSSYGSTRKSVGTKGPRRPAPVDDYRRADRRLPEVATRRGNERRRLCHERHVRRVEREAWFSKMVHRALVITRIFQC